VFESCIAQSYLQQIIFKKIGIPSFSVVKGTFKYTHKLVKGQRGAITSWVIDFTKGTFEIKANNVDLTGLGCPLQLETKFGSYITRGQTSENIVNNSKAIPTRLMRTYKDTLIVSKESAKNSVKSASDSFTVQGEIAVADINHSNLANQDVNIVWGDQTFTIPAGSFTAKTGKSYKCSKVNAQGESNLVTAAIDLDKCTFSVSIKDCDLDVTSGEVEFGINFTGFDETAEIDLQ
jgi:hypothetical protein